MEVMVQVENFKAKMSRRKPLMACTRGVRLFIRPCRGTMPAAVCPPLTLSNHVMAQRHIATVALASPPCTLLAVIWLHRGGVLRSVRAPLPSFQLHALSTPFDSSALLVASSQKQPPLSHRFAVKTAHCPIPIHHTDEAWLCEKKSSISVCWCLDCLEMLDCDAKYILWKGGKKKWSAV